MIDGLVSQVGDALRNLWHTKEHQGASGIYPSLAKDQDQGGFGLYPPPSFHVSLVVEYGTVFSRVSKAMCSDTDFQGKIKF